MVSRYSTVYCDVTGDGEKELILGAPRAFNYKGTFRVYFSSKEKGDEVMKSYGGMQIRFNLTLMWIEHYCKC